MLHWIQKGFNLPWIRGPPPRFHEGNSCQSLDKDEQRFLDKEVARMLSNGSWERTSVATHVSKAFLVPKPGTMA